MGFSDGGGVEFEGGGVEFEGGDCRFGLLFTSFTAFLAKEKIPVGALYDLSVILFCLF